MEISKFLQAPSTLSLREKFLSIENERRSRLLILLKEIKKDNFKHTNENIEKVNTIFHEAHKLKGAGGTYGFNEISFFYFELLKYVKPPSVEMRIYTKIEFKNIINIFKWWNIFYKKYVIIFQSLLIQDNIKKQKGILFVSQNRNHFFNNLISATIKKKKILFSCYNYEDLLLALNYINIEFCIIELNSKISSALDLMKTFSKSFKTFFWDETNNEEILKDILLSYEKILEGKNDFLINNKNIRFL